MDTTWNRLNLLAQKGDLTHDDRIQFMLLNGLDVLGMDVGTVFYTDGESAHIKASTEAWQIGKIYPLNEMLCQFVFKRGDVLALYDLDTNDWQQFSIHPDFRYTTYIGIPLVVKDMYYGAVFFGAYEQRGEAFSERDVAYLRVLSTSLRATLLQTA
ncbi:MAG: GAF domain-containing protein [Chloroflexota bacterium]